MRGAAVVGVGLGAGLALVAACASTGSSSGDGDTTSAGDDGGGAEASSGGVLPDGGGVFDGARPDSGGAVGEVFGHSATQLFKLEPFSKAVTTIGTFDCVTVVQGLIGPCGDGMWDMAIDKDGNMFGTALSISDQLCSGFTGRLVKIDKATAHCTVVASAPSVKYPNSLTFVPVGTVDPAKEVLVGYIGADYMQIDATSGTMTKIGSLNPNTTGTAWYSSGDIVAVAGGKTYLTAKSDPSAMYAGTDTLLEVDPKTGQALKAVGDTGFSKLWGIGFWAGTVYGFSATGQLCSIDTTTGKGTAIPLGSVPANLAWWGAGSTTVAPLVPPH